MFRRALGAATFVAAVLLATGPMRRRPRRRPRRTQRTRSPPPTPRTPWGHPDLQGTWDYRTITPLERPREFGEP